MAENQENQQEENQNNNSKIIGSYLSLITKAESRYEGTLVEVDRVKKTMSLKNVKSMGTEGRRSGVNELPPGDSLLGTVKFRVDLVKTFEIIEKPKEEEAVEEEDDLDPAIISTTDEQKPKQQEKESEGEVKKPYTKGPRRNDDWTKGTNVKKSTPGGEQEEDDNDNEHQSERKDPRDRQYAGQQKEKIVGELKGVNDKYQKKFDEAYDFNKHQITPADEKKEEPEKKEGEEVKTEKPKYDKNVDFFDSITNSTLEPTMQRGRGGRGNRGGYRGNRGGDDAFGGGYRGNRGGDDAFARGGYRGRGNYRGNYGDQGFGEEGNNYYRGRGNYRGNRGRGNYSNYGDGTTGTGRETANGDRKKLYSDTLRDPNDPNYHKLEGDDQQEEGSKPFFDNGNRGRGRGERGGYRGNRGGWRGRGGGRPMTGQQAEQRDEETFGTFTSQNFKFNHENSTSRGGRGGRGRGQGQGQGQGEQPEYGNRGGQRGGRGGGYRNDFYKGGNSYDYPTNEVVVEDGHKDFFDIKKKPNQQSRTKNRFAGLMNLDKQIRKSAKDDEDSEEEVPSKAEEESKAD